MIALSLFLLFLLCLHFDDFCLGDKIVAWFIHLSRRFLWLLFDRFDGYWIDWKEHINVLHVSHWKSVKIYDGPSVSRIKCVLICRARSDEIIQTLENEWCQITYLCRLPYSRRNTWCHPPILAFVVEQPSRLFVGVNHLMIVLITSCLDTVFVSKPNLGSK